MVLAGYRQLHRDATSRSLERALRTWRRTPLERAGGGRKWLMNFTPTPLDKGIAGGFMVGWRYRNGASYGGAGMAVNDTAGARRSSLGGCLGRG